MNNNMKFGNALEDRLARFTAGSLLVFAIAPLCLWYVLRHIVPGFGMGFWRLWSLWFCCMWVCRAVVANIAGTWRTWSGTRDGKCENDEYNG